MMNHHHFLLVSMVIFLLNNLVSSFNITIALMSMSFIRPANDYLYYGTMGAACPLAIDDLRLYDDMSDNLTISYIMQPSECDKGVINNKVLSNV